MAIDYSIYDLKRSFTIHEVAMAYAQTEHELENQQTAYSAIYGELLRDVKGNYLQHRVVRDIRENWINRDSATTDYTDWSKAEIWRVDLSKWFEGRKLKPKFLFKEVRTSKNAVSPKAMRPEPKSKKENELYVVVEKAYLVLRSELRRPPDADEMLKALKERRVKFDPDEIITEIKGKSIHWKPTDGGAGKVAGRKRLQNILSDLNKKYTNQSFIK